MSKAGGIAGGIILMLIGLLASGVSFAGLPVVNSQLLDPEIPSALQMVRDEGSAMVKDMIPSQIVDELKPNRDDAIPMIKALLPTMAGATLTGIRDMILATIGVNNLPYLVNGSVSYMTLAQTLDAVNDSVLDWPTTLNMFFNLPNFQAATGAPVKGVSEWATVGSFPAPSQVYITAGNAGAPGILQADIGGGTPGIVGFLQLGATNPATAMAAYGIDAANLTIMMGYIATYLFPLVPGIVYAQTGSLLPACTNKTGADWVLFQWATKMLMPTGFPLPIGVGGANIVGWESPVPMTITQAKKLWNSTNGYGLVSSTGIARWYAATSTALKGYLASNNSMLPAQVDLIVPWINQTSGAFQQVIRGAAAMQAGVPMVADYTNLALRLFLAQWDHGALMPKTELFTGSGLYFEMMLPIANRIPSDTCIALWTDATTDALTNPAGWPKWVAAGKDYESAEYTALKVEFSLTDPQMTAVTDFANRLLTVAALTLEVINDDAVYTRMFLTQWDHLALLGEPLEFEGVTGLEVNMPEGHHMSTYTCMELWNDASEYALTSEAGWAKWVVAAYDRKSETYATLQAEFDVTDTQMRYLCDWVVQVREQVVPALADATEMAPVPIASVVEFLSGDQGNLIMGGVGGFGAALTIIGLVMAIAFGRKK